MSKKLNIYTSEKPTLVKTDFLSEDATALQIHSSMNLNSDNAIVQQLIDLPMPMRTFVFTQSENGAFLNYTENGNLVLLDSPLGNIVDVGTVLEKMTQWLCKHVIINLRYEFTGFMSIHTGSLIKELNANNMSVVVVTPMDFEIDESQFGIAIKNHKPDEPKEADAERVEALKKLDEMSKKSVGAGIDSDNFVQFVVGLTKVEETNPDLMTLEEIQSVYQLLDCYIDYRKDRGFDLES